MRAIFSHRIEVRFRDCDPMGHVNNAVYLTYLEQARLAQWRALWRFGGLQGASPPASASHADAPGNPVDAEARVRAAGDEPGIIVARAEIDYRLPARYGDVLDVKIGLGAVGRTSFTYDYEIVDAEGRIVASARSVQVMYDYRLGRPVPIPDEIRRIFDTL